MNIKNENIKEVLRTKEGFEYFSAYALFKGNDMRNEKAVNDFPIGSSRYNKAVDIKEREGKELFEKVEFWKDKMKKILPKEINLSDVTVFVMSHF